jgi:FKBP-type peptidyl-prolyl cis-trans isomerase
MTQLFRCLLVSGLCLAVVSCAPSATPPPQEMAAEKELTTLSDKVSYLVGQDVGNSLKNRDAGLDLELVMEGIQDSFHGKASPIPQEEAAEIKREYAQKTREERAAKAAALGEKNRAEGQAFLAENGKKEGVVTTASGLQYQVVSEGTGPKPKASEQVRVHYAGTLLDGSEFDSSRTRGQPAAFYLNRVIRGWTEGLQLMPVGSKYRFFIPPELAYGARGAGQKIGPNATLIFDVELLEIVGQKQESAPPTGTPKDAG